MTHFKWRVVNLTLTALAKQTHLSPTATVTPLSHLLHRASSLSTFGHLCFSSATSDGQGHLLSQSNPNSIQPSQAPFILLHLCFSQNPRPAKTKGYINLNKISLYLPFFLSKKSNLSKHHPTHKLTIQVEIGANLCLFLAFLISLELIQIHQIKSI